VNDTADPVSSSVHLAREALERADTDDPATALPLLRAAQDHLTAAIDEAMAAAVVTEGETLRSAGQLAGLSENAVGPRLARTSLLAAYQSDSGRVTASGVERARYDVEQGRHKPGADPDGVPPAPMRFRPRRGT
jgi:hypothetical protein